jgi:hypothetical protein
MVDNPKNKKKAIADGALVVSVRRAEDALDKCRDGIYALIKQGELDSYLEGRRRRITVASIERYIDRQVAKQTEFVRYRHPDNSRAPP